MPVSTTGRRGRRAAAAAVCALAVLTLGHLNACAARGDGAVARGGGAAAHGGSAAVRDHVPAAFSVPDSAGLDDAGYFAVAERLQRPLNRLWSARLGRYEPGRGAADTEVNADELLIYAVAAQHGQRGLVRDDARARSIARFLVSAHVFTPRPPPGGDPEIRGPGWLGAPDSPHDRHPVFDAAVADGLAHAYVARAALRLDGATVARIRDEVHRVATSPDWRWPALRLNQINWYCAISAADALVNGEGAALAAEMGRQLARFLGGGNARPAVAGNFGAGLRFHYLPQLALHARGNLDSPEYANIVLSFGRFYTLARADGMAPPARLALLHDWVRRVIAGYWTHAGYLNWDTGLGFSRWHQRKKAALSQQGLIAVAATPELQPGPQWGAWAKWILDRGLRAYAALTARERGIPAALAYGVDVIPQGRDDANLAAAHYASNAVRAVDAGLGAAPATRPPALYAYDPDDGRLAVTTPSYNTAIVADNQHAFPYGGLDIARLFDADQDVAANLGGRDAAAFGLRARRHGRLLLSTQYGSHAYAPGGTPLRLSVAPAGVGATAASGAGHAYAGPFTDLRAFAALRAHGVRATVGYRFTPAWIEAGWTVKAARAVDPTVQFPSWGARAHVVVTLDNGRTIGLGGAPRPLADVRSLEIVSARSGYRVTPLTHPRGATLRLSRVRRQASDPDPGPTLDIRLARGRHGAFAVRLTVVREPHGGAAGSSARLRSRAAAPSWP